MRMPLVCLAVLACFGLLAGREIKQNRRDIQVMCQQLEELNAGECHPSGPAAANPGDSVMRSYTCTGFRVMLPVSCLQHQGKKRAGQ